jgi:hypothetical protein
MTLLQLQRQMAASIMQPLTRSDEISPKAKVGFIKPNDRLTARERLEIYSRSYWYRLIDGMYEDFPGLRAVVGQRAFDRLIRAYIADCPSRSYTMRNLGSQLQTWLRHNPRFAGKKQALALDMVSLEWAHIEAWDGKAEPILGPEDLLELGPNLRIGLQPYIQLLDLKYPVDDLRVRVNTDEHEAASNAVTKPKARRMIAGAKMKPRQIYVAVHRYDLEIYYRRLASEEFRLLEALRNGRNLGRALAACCKGSQTPLQELQANLEKWFATWAELGWFCRS